MTTQCTEPGCSGTVQDGYCVECGMPPSSAPAPGTTSGDGAVPGGGGAPSAAPDRCAQPGCGGTIADGYCLTCGEPPAAAPTGPGTTGTSPTAGSVSASTGMSGGSLRTGGTRGSSGRSARRGMLGAGLVEVPRVPYRDPSAAVMRDPRVPEKRRRCSNCEEPVGRTREGKPGRTEGFCPKCGTAFSYTPKLGPGDLVAGQYEVLGCLAHGGLGWIYLAKDRNVSDRWVVLKGLLNTTDPDAIEAAAAERAFLAEVEHPNIVKIYNFVQHGSDGYIVMEYVGGESLKDILLRHREENGGGSLPLAQAIAYALEVLQAFAYLHARGLVYCDFKPDNVIQSEEQLRLIDLGGVRRIGDDEGAIYGTKGYQAPEIADHGPSVGSDLYTVGRALAVMSFEFKGYQTTYEYDLPPREDVPVLARFESFDRFLRRATHRDPDERFQDAVEMAEQLTGVLREVLAAEDGHPRPAQSTLFGPERFAPGAAVSTDAAATGEALPPVPPRVAAASLPVPLVDAADPAAQLVAGLTALETAQQAAALASVPEQTPEVLLATARVRAESGEFPAAHALLDQVEAGLPGDWRIAWHRAVALLAEGRLAEAGPRFDQIYALLPGEAAPRLALAHCREAHAPADAARLYETVWRTDDTYINAAFGLARVHLARGDRAAAVAVLDSVPRLSIRYVPAQVAAITTTVRGRPPAELTAAELTGVGDRLGRLDLEGRRRDRLAAEVLEAALEWTRRPAGQSPGQGGKVLGVPLDEPSLRRELEKTYRALARHSQDRRERRELIDAANAVRPRTLL
ncbi:tetratricopeptide repeat protein [Actinomadura namibiensis]|uniref:non-specific serine/threonine protein kinase n=2 Tax=Actinomadura TaxID=1988 RepID=A0A7W3QJX2_ACTNM|nr:serine/threonine-protein kinase [Actinomadura namibiensis]MBA8949393.1 serine/threonine-protein kinase PknG [Actinomadura namibiensis]